MVDESGIRLPSETTPSIGATRYRAPLVSLLLCMSLLAGFLLTLSLAVYDRTLTDWGDRESFDVSSKQTEAGMPTRLVYNEVSATGHVTVTRNQFTKSLQKRRICFKIKANETLIESSI